MAVDGSIWKRYYGVHSDGNRKRDDKADYSVKQGRWAQRGSRRKGYSLQWQTKIPKRRLQSTGKERRRSRWHILDFCTDRDTKEVMMGELYSTVGNRRKRWQRGL